MKPAPGRRIAGARHRPAELDVRARIIEVFEGSHGRDECLGVRVVRRLEDRLSRTDVDELAEVHDADAVGEVPDDVQVVGDEEIRDSPVRLHVQQQVQDGRLHRDVQGRDRLVAQDERRLPGEGPGDGDPLLETAGEGRGTHLQVPRLQPHRRGQI